MWQVDVFVVVDVVVVIIIPALLYVLLPFFLPFFSLFWCSCGIGGGKFVKGRVQTENVAQLEREPCVLNRKPGHFIYKYRLREWGSET